MVVFVFPSTLLSVTTVLRNLQAGKSHACVMKIEGRLMQACFIKIHQVFAKKNVLLF